MSDVIAPDLFGAKEYAGVRLMEFEEEGYGAPGHVDPPQMIEAIRAHLAHEEGYGAPGHVDPPQMIEAIRAHLAHVAVVWGNEPEFVALLVEDVPAVEDVEHVWATFDEESQHFAWDSVAEDAKGAFPMTVVMP